MQHLEVTPPEVAWSYISTQLDANAVRGEAAIQKKMKNFNEEPPAIVWNAVEKHLNKSTGKIVFIPQHKKDFYLRYAAAAVLVGFITIGITLYLSNNKKNFLAGDSTKKNSSAEVFGNDTSLATQSPLNSENVERKNSEPEIVSVTNKSSRFSSGTHAKYAHMHAFNGFVLQKAAPRSYTDQNRTYEDVKLVAPNLNDNALLGINSLKANDDYFVTTGPNGEIVRVSNKLSEVLPLLDEGTLAQEYLDVVIKESIAWKQRLYNLRNKLNKISPSPDNFFDIVQLAAMLTDEKIP
ncbi:MAG TPA: hypothetical protein VFN30_13760 [Chitinophagaceae bacterium]|nr:hypothetical protein [Chitinophagaceae bacterium]